MAEIRKSGIHKGACFHIQIQFQEEKTMKQIWNGIQIAFSALGGFLGWFLGGICLLYTSPSPRDPKTSRMPSSA